MEMPSPSWRIALSALLAVALSGIAPLLVAQDRLPTPSTLAAREVVAVIDSIDAAARRHDRAALERLYAADFLFVHGQRGIVTREEQISGLLTRDGSAGRMLHLAPDSVRVVGDVTILRLRQQGAFSTSFFIRHEGRWQLAQTQTTLLVSAPLAVAIDSAALAAYAGHYTRNDTYVDVTRTGDTLFIQRAGGVRLPVVPIGPDRFHDRFGATLTFGRDAAGKVDTFRYLPATGEERLWTKTNP